jgi:hypothetical protein
MGQGFGQVYMMQTDIPVIQFPDDGNKHGAGNFGSLTIEPPDVAASPRKFFLEHSSPAVTTCPV